MNFFNHIWGVFVFTGKRIFAQKGLVLAILLGFTTATALSMSIPIYADAAYQKILERDVIGEETANQDESLSPAVSAFSFMFRYIGSWYGMISWDKLQAVDNYLSNQAISDLGLPLKQLIRFFRTDYFPFVAKDVDVYEGSEFLPLAWISLASLSNWPEKVTFAEGSPPADTDPTSDGVINTWVNEDLATEIGLQVGEVYNLLTSNDDGKTREKLPVRIAGIWKVKDAKDPFWFYKPSEFRYVLLLADEDFINSALPAIGNQLDLALWYMLMDNSAVHSRDVPSLLQRIGRTRARAGVLQEDMRLDISPEEKLRKYQQAASSLMVFLYILYMPILAMVLAFIGLVGGMVVSQRQNQIAVLRSRGASMYQILGYSFIESLLIGLVALGIGAYLSLYIAQFFGRVNSFLDFSAPSNMKVSITAEALQLGIAITILSMLALIIPTLNAARHTIITYKQEQARQLRPPWWQRAWLDGLLLIPAVYGAYLLRQQGGFNIPVAGGIVSQDPFQNPLLVLVPALGIFALTLLGLRLLPFFMSLFSRILAKTRSIGALAATRHLARTPGNYHAPLVLLVLTLSLSTYTATLAQTLDRHLHDQLYYKNGSDGKLIEFGEMPGDGGNLLSGGESNGQDYWFFLPVSEHLKVPGIRSATRVARSEITISPPAGQETGMMLAVDRVDFPQTAFWREDFASNSLGQLMNELALTTEGVLVPRSFLAKYNLQPGDDLKATLYKLGGNREFLFKIVGAFDLFPSWYPDQGPLMVANLDYIFEMVGGEFPYEVWINTAPGINYDQMFAGLDDLSLRVSSSYLSLPQLEEQQARPERQGLFGLLSVGFTALALLTTLGFLLYAFFSFRRRFIELGIQRAIGLSAMQMMILLGVELAFLLGLGLAAGTALGVGVSNLFIPYLQVGTSQTAHIPPFLVQIDWMSVFRIYILFVLLFAVALTILAVMLLRMKIFQAVKLGETV